MHWVNGLFHIVTVSSVGFASSAALGPLPQCCEMRNALFLMTGAGGILLLWLHHPSRTQFSRSLSCGWAETMNAGFMKFIPQIQRNRGKKPHHIHGYRLREHTVHSLSSTLITVKLLGCNAPASSPPLPEQQAFTCSPTSIHSISPLTHLLLSHPSSFLAGGIQHSSVPLIPSLNLERIKSPLCLEASGYSPVNTPPHTCFFTALLPIASRTSGIASFPVCFPQPPPLL